MKSGTSISSDEAEWVSPLQAFYSQERDHPQRSVFVQPNGDGSVTQYSWQQVGEEARRVATYLKSLDLPERSHIALLSNNCAHWIMADLAIWMAGYVSVPLFPVLTAHTVEYILQHSNAQALFVGKLDKWDSMREGVADSLPCISFPYSPPAACNSSKQWNEIIQQYAPLEGDPVPSLDDLATIIYTSGTTGAPKGVMHNFHSAAVIGSLGSPLYKLSSNDRFLSYLPLAHVAERAIVEISLLYSGFTVYFSWSLETFAADLRRARPTVFFAVPRIWSKLQQRVLEEIEAAKLDRLLAIPVVKWIIRYKVLHAMGLHAVRFGLSGAAPLAPDTIRWYQNLGLEILEGYGMTENFAYSHFSAPGDATVGSVGRACPQVDCRIADNGEILVRSPANMMGYYKDPEKSREAIDNEGWLHTGDVGEIDANGRLKITGRIKEIFKTSKGKYVAPAPIENRLLANHYIEQICVTGASLPQPIALAVLAESAQRKLLDSGFKQLLETQFQSLLDDARSEFDKHESLRCMAIVAERWSVDNNFMTPTLKIKRDQIDNYYGNKFNSWTNSGAKIIWEV